MKKIRRKEHEDVIRESLTGSDLALSAIYGMGQHLSMFATDKFSKHLGETIIAVHPGSVLFIVMVRSILFNPIKIRKVLNKEEKASIILSGVAYILDYSGNDTVSILLHTGGKSLYILSKSRTALAKIFMKEGYDR